MLSASDLGGLMAMMPAFATDNAADIHATATVDVGRLHHGLDRMIRDGADVIATTGSFGECHTLLPDEFRTLAHETVAVVKKRVPLFVGVTSVNSREAVQKIKVVDGAGADGILLGVPYYFPSSVENAVMYAPAWIFVLAPIVVSFSTSDPRPTTTSSPIWTRSRTHDWSPRITRAPSATKACITGRETTRSPSPNEMGATKTRRMVSRSRTR